MVDAVQTIQCISPYLETWLFRTTTSGCMLLAYNMEPLLGMKGPYSITEPYFGGYLFRPAANVLDRSDGADRSVGIAPTQHARWLLGQTHTNVIKTPFQLPSHLNPPFTFVSPCRYPMADTLFSTPTLENILDAILSKMLR